MVYTSDSTFEFLRKMNFLRTVNAKSVVKS